MMLDVVVFIGKRLGNTWKRLISQRGKQMVSCLGVGTSSSGPGSPLDSQFTPKQEMGIMVKSTKSVTIGENTADINSPVIGKVLIFAGSDN